MREVPLQENREAQELAAEVSRGGVEVVVFLTGVGARAWYDVAALAGGGEAFLAGLRRCRVVVRGPKPAVVLREWQVPIAVQVPEPNTWRELLEAIQQLGDLRGVRVAVQEYGVPNRSLYEGLEELGAQVLPVPVYRWALPEDLGPLREAVRGVAAGAFDCVVFTSAQQWHHVCEIAEEQGVREAFVKQAGRGVVASIGPTATETLVAGGLPPDIEPEHPKMGHLAIALGRRAGEVLRAKRGLSGL
jgi:uroporphyrinogen-III synthase